MHVARIEVGISETFNLGNYNNTKPSITLHADIHPGDDIDAVISELHQKAKAVIEEHVDAALMADGQPPKFYDGPRADAYISHLLRLGTITPSDKKAHRSDLNEHLYRWGPSEWDRIARRWPLDRVAEKITAEFAPDEDSLPAQDYPFVTLNYPFNDDALAIINERKAEWLKQHEEREEQKRLAREQEAQARTAARQAPIVTEADDDEDDEDEGDDE